MLAGAAALGLVAFAIGGGEYGTRDLLAIRRQVREQRARIAALRLEIDSLARLERALRTDSAAQERAARERFGMLRDGEVLYQVVPDSN